MESKIETYGLTDTVRELRLVCGFTQAQAAEVINEKYLPEGAEPITTMTVSRWEKENGISVDTRSSLRGIQRLNSLDAAYKVKNRVEKHVQKLSGIIDELRHNEEKLSELASISNAYMGALKQLDAINLTISKIQAEALKTEKVKVLLTTLTAVLDKYPAVKAEFLMKIKSEDEYGLFI